MSFSSEQPKRQPVVQKDMFSPESIAEVDAANKEYLRNTKAEEKMSLEEEARLVAERYHTTSDNINKHANDGKWYFGHGGINDILIEEWDANMKALDSNDENDDRPWYYKR